MPAQAIEFAQDARSGNVVIEDQHILHGQHRKFNTIQEYE
jgi:hypothetical protein